MACRAARSISRSWPDGQVSNVAPLLLGVFSNVTLKVEVSAARVWSNEVADGAREGLGCYYWSGWEPTSRSDESRFGHGALGKLT